MNPVVLLVLLLADHPRAVVIIMTQALFMGEANHLAVFTVGRDQADAGLQDLPDIFFIIGHGNHHGIEDFTQHTVAGMGDDRVLEGTFRGFLQITGEELAADSTPHLGADPLIERIVEAP